VGIVFRSSALFSIVLALASMLTIISGLSAAVPMFFGPGEQDGTIDGDHTLVCLDLPVDVSMTVERSSGSEVTISATITSRLAAEGASIALIAPWGTTLSSGEWSETVDLAADRPLVRTWALELGEGDERTVYCEVRSAGKLMGSGSIGLSLSGGEVAEASSNLALRTSVAGGASSSPLTLGMMASPAEEAASDYLEVQWGYYDQGLTTERPCRGAYAELWLMDGLGDYQVLASAHTDSAGKVNFTGISAGTYWVVLFADGQAGRVTDGRGLIYGWTTGDIDLSSGATMHVVIIDGARGVWAAYHNMLDIWQWVRDQVAWEASPVTVHYPSLDWPQTDGEIIYMPNTGQAATSIWDRGTILHEYAHCIMYQMRGGSFPPSDGGSHYIFSEMDEAFALIEGWAEFMQCAVDNDAYGLDAYLGGRKKIIEDLVIADVQDYGDWDGKIIEGAIANVMWDIFDGVNVSDAPSWDDSGIGDQVDRMFPTLWSVMLQNSPDSIDEIWEHWPQHDQYIWAVFYHARINYDIVSPTNPTGVTASPAPGAWTSNNEIQVTLNGASDANGVAGYWYCWSPTPMDPTGENWSSSSTLPSFTAPDGVWYLCVRSQDRAENIASGYYSEVWKIDTTSPATTMNLSGSEENGWYAAGVTVTLSTTDAGSGTDLTQYRVDGGSWQDYAGPFTISSNGSHVIDIFSIDLAGNNGSWSHTVLVDAAAPSTGHMVNGTLGNDGWYTSAVTVELLPGDQGSGVAYTRYRVGDGPWVEYTAPFTLTADGVHVVQYHSVDALGNTESTISLTVRIDPVPPSTTLQKNGIVGERGWYTSEVEVSLVASDGGSGVATILYRLDGGPWRNYTAPLVLTDGSYLLQYRSIDRAGNSEGIRSERMLVDATAPSIVLPVDGAVLTSLPSTVWSLSDEGSGVSQAYISIDGGAFVAFDPSLLSALPDGEHELTIRVVDSAGNVAVSTASFRIDTNPLSPTGPNGPWPIIALAVALCGAAAVGLVMIRRKRT
jgi:hypothetical protein